MKQTSISIGIAVLLIGSSLFLTGSAGGDANGGTGGSKDNVTMNGSTQIIAVSAGRKNLPPSGTTDIEIPPQKAGAVVQGLCAMGMYNFSIKFE